MPFNKMLSNIGEEIGKGAFGTVYILKDDPSLCVKVSDKKSSCREWSNEYKKIKKFMKKINETESYNSLKMVRVVEPLEFIETDTLCSMVLPRIYRPEGRDYIAPTLQAKLGEKSEQKVFDGRGEFIGLKQIRKYVDEDDLKTACYELGVVMALIHHVGKNDAYDVEVYLGKEYNTKKNRFYIADFDMSEPIESYNVSTVDRIVWSLDAVYYFPREDVDSELFEKFKDGYSSITKNPLLVEEIFSQYG